MINKIKIEKTQYYIDNDYANTTTLDQYLVTSPIFHPLWSQWLISLIHLRDVEGAPPAVKYNSEATHEIVCASLSPEMTANARDVKTVKLLTPIDICVQFKAETDNEAEKVIASLIENIKEGRLSPDQDYRNIWKSMINGITGTGWRYDERI